MISRVRRWHRTSFGQVGIIAVTLLSTLQLSAAELFDQASVDHERQQSAGIRSYNLGAGHAMESLTGPAALSHLQNLRARKGAALERALAKLEARGYRATDHVVVFRSKRGVPTSQAGTLPGPLSTISTTEGEVVFWAWDDGDPSTWEGTMYAENCATGGYLVSEGQYDTITADTTWEENIVYEPGYGGPDQQNAKIAGERHNLGNPRASFMKDWLACVVGNCTIVLAGCVFSGPFYLDCVILGCHAAVIGCALSGIIQDL